MLPIKYSWLVLALLFATPFFALECAAQNNYSISGTVTDGQSGEPLPGATVAIKNTSLGTSSDGQGTFVLKNIPQEKATIIVAYIGYEDYVFEHDFSKKPAPVFDIKLQSTAVELELVQVEGRAEGNLRAFIEQKKSENIKNVIAAEQIASFPDMNAAEAMQRIPGITLQRDQGEGRYVQLRGTPPELTVFNVNGEQVPSPEGRVRYVGMDIIPADQIEFVEVNKVLTPDMDADGIGGAVNIKTKEATGEQPEIRATLAGGYNNLRQAPIYNLQFSYGQRYGKLGFQVNSSYFQNNQGSDNIEYKYAKGPFFGSQDAGQDNYYVQYREVQFRHYDITRTRISVSPTLDLRFNKNSFLYLRGMYNSFTDDETRRRLVYGLDDALSATYYLYGGVKHDIKARVKKQELSTLAFGGEHRIGRATLDYQLFYALASESEPDRMEASFDSPGQAIAIDFDLSDPDYPRATFPNPSNAGNVTRYEDYELDDLLFENSLATDRNLTPRANIKIPYSIGSHSNGYFKFGGKIRQKKKGRDIRSQAFAAYFEESSIYPGLGPELSLATISDGFREDNLLGHSYALEYMPSEQKLRDFYEFYPQHFIFDRTATRVQSFGEDYKAEETIYAGYGMVRHDFDKLMVLGGLRWEETDIDYQGFRIVTDKGRFKSIDTLTDQRIHRFLLPQVQMKYSVNENFNLRAALTYSYSRPNFDDVLPYREEDRDEVRYGNPDLKYPLSKNLDFLAEYYFPKGILSGGIFYKEIDDFIFYYKRFAHEGDPKDYGLVEITKAINGNRASVYGAELQAQFKFKFLPGFLRNFGLYANYTYTHSEAFINKRYPANYTDAIVIFGEDDLDLFSSKDEREMITLPGQASHTANAALFYDSRKFFTRLTLNYQDDFLYQLGADADLDEYYGKALRLDFTANVFVTEHLKLFLDLINLTNTPQKFYLGEPGRVKKQEFYSWWGRLGVKLGF